MVYYIFRNWTTREHCRKCKLSQYCAWLILVPMCYIIVAFALIASLLCAPFWLIISPDGFKETWRNLASWRGGSESFLEAVTDGTSSNTCWVTTLIAFFAEDLTKEEIETARRLEEVREREREERKAKEGAGKERRYVKNSLKREHEGRSTS